MPASKNPPQKGFRRFCRRPSIMDRPSTNVNLSILDVRTQEKIFFESGSEFGYCESLGMRVATLGRRSDCPPRTGSADLERSHLPPITKLSNSQKRRGFT